ncbi:MAG: hypothetical protein JRF63_01210 [Deltaproteobacteria bacterium]|nr:hypothetical protein [Deltaproteobacteria bacterium]
MKYRCIPCDHVFEASDGKKPRCPRCMGIHDLERLSGDRPKGKGRRPWLVPVVILLLAAAVFAVYFALDQNEDTETTATTSGDDLVDALVALGVSQKDAVIPFEVTDEIRGFAEKATDGADDSDAVQALLDALGKSRKDGKWELHPQREARSEDSKTAAELLARMGEDGKGPVAATSYELACLVLAAARAVEVDARMAQIHSFEGERRPADPTGRLGRYGVVVGQGDGKSLPPLFDPYAHRSGKAAKGDYTVLTDEQAIAPYYSHRSLVQLARFDTSKAFELNDLATKLDPDNATFRAGRAYIFIYSEAPTEALAELEKAVKRRDDAVTRLMLADLLIKTIPVFGDPRNLKRAENEINVAIEKMPDYVEAHALLSMVHMARGDLPTAEATLAAAQRLDPGSPEVAMSYANFYLQQNMNEEAIDKAEQAARLMNESPDSLLALAGVYRRTARFDEMRITLDKLYEKMKTDELARFIRGVFGYDPEGEEIEQDDTDKGELALGGLGDAGVGGLELQLGGDQNPLGGGGLKLGEGLGGGLGGSDQGGGLKLGGSQGGGLGGSGHSGGLGGGLQSGDLQLKVTPPGN